MTERAMWHLRTDELHPSTTGFAMLGPLSLWPCASYVMRLLLALLLPWLQFFTIGRPFAGLICLILQITVIGWIPAAIWSVYALSQYKTDEKIRKSVGSR
jgi:uncharacterized membrane protein YqaE (UPF0057 family)